jgi:lipopolysaccharide/colanic/teichoic acid biosynthesis glycosyltransferase
MADKGLTQARGLLSQRALDYVLSGVLLIAFAPILITAGLLVWIGDRGPVFYRQQRAGLGGRPFELMKFRSMHANDLNPVDMPEVRSTHPLVTPVGRWLRRFKVDELPQLWNVFRGDMSLVGPRPRTMEQLVGDGALERRRLLRRPGMTGWAQVNGNTEIDWSERFLLDAWYVDHWSLGLDFVILVMTIGVIVRGETSNRSAVERAIEYADCVGWRS